MPALRLRQIQRLPLGRRDGAAQTVTKTADQSNSTTTGADVTDLTVPIGPTQILHFHAYLICSAAVATTGIQLGINGPASPTQVDATITGWTGTTTQVQTAISAYESYQANASSGGTTRQVYEIRGRVINGTVRGTLAVRAKSEVASSAITVHKGSWIEVFHETQPTGG